LLLGLPGLAKDEMLIFDLVTLNAQRLRARRAAGCEAHQRAGAPPTQAPAGQLEVIYASLGEAVAAGFTVIDVRDARERLAEPVPVPNLHLPMSKLLGEAVNLELDGRYLLVCVSGKRSAAAADLLHSQGLRGCRSLQGGLKGLKAIA
jgi:adenylyltransferase/sulfurtransferase